jgi:Tfp pilus assembly protein PilO
MYKILQEQVQPRTLSFLLVSLILMLLVGNYLYVIKNPFKNFWQHQQTLALLQDEVQTGIPLQNQIERQQQLVEKLNSKLHGTGRPKLAVNKMVAYIIGELDKSAKRHQVNLTSVKPQNPEILFTFKELPFQVEISGDYFNLFAWLKDIEKNLGSIVIKKFHLSAGESNKQKKMFLTIAAYQFEDEK